jgi:hypothetical protein
MVDEDIKLKDAVQTHGGKKWDAIAALVPGRTRTQSRSRWVDVLDPNIDRTIGRTGTWSEDEDIKLNDAVQTHGGKNGGDIAAVVPGRTKILCWCRWHRALVPDIGRASWRTGNWTSAEDIKLKDPVQTYGGKDWDAIAVLVPGRTRIQCRDRWKKHIDPNRRTIRGKEHGAALNKAPALG